ncbi:MAG: nodulation protein NfeD [Flavobacteriales bacterium]|jgi:membrane-bound serine protease (ClpP class)|nr:nodulation protein NfeD [Flavobacteriales bacterium]
MSKILLVYVLVIFAFTAIGQDTKTVYLFDIKEEIAAPVWRKTQKAMDEAHDMDVDAIVINMNTYGGAVDAADSIRTRLLNSKIPVYVLIENNAASAGALISIACDSIFMKPGATIGAATVVNQNGEVQAEKIQSYFREKMRATAEFRNRDPDIAEAMVDADKVVEGVSEEGKIVTLTASKAIELGFCEGEYTSNREVLAHCGITNYTIVKQELTTIDAIISWLINPAVSSILILVIFGGIYFELQSPGIGFPIAAAITAAFLYFMPLYLEGFAENWEIILFIVGLALIAVEVFVIPGFGVAGIAGIALAVTGLSLSLVGNIGFDFKPVQSSRLIEAFLIVLISGGVSITGSLFLAVKLFESGALSRLVLQADQKSSDGYVGTSTQEFELIGQLGEAYTDLRPAGKVVVSDNIYDATSDSGFVDAGTKVKVISYTGAQVKVRTV